MLSAWLTLLLVPAVVSLWVDLQYNGPLPTYEESMVGIYSSPSKLNDHEPHNHNSSEPFDTQTGAADGLRGSTRTAWPIEDVHGQNCRTVHYCFVNQESRDQLNCMLQEAINMWHDALSGRPGPEGRHSPTVMEVPGTMRWDIVRNEFTPDYCFGSFDIPSRTAGNWNPRVPDDALAIEYNYQGVKVSTSGYTPKEVLASRWRHQMRLGVSASGHAEAHIVAHELGHVFGMLHEHQRNDRDSYVEYNPTYINGFLATMQRAMAAIQPRPAAEFVMQKLRDDYEFAREYGFSGAAYTKGGFEPENPIDDPSGFDYDSIMLYPSTFGTSASNDRCATDVNFCPLAKVVRDAQGKVVGKERIEEKFKPSERDAGWIRKYYPWPAA